MTAFAQLKVPVMLIAGLDDQINPIAMNREMAAKMQKPWLIEIAGAGHMLMLEKPEEVANALKTFITFVKENS
jgi:pimeloyl-ACP methyl ester carboxylesterase